MEEQFEALIEQYLEKGYAVVDGFVSPLLVDSLRENLNKKYDDGQLHLAGIGNEARFKRVEGIRNDFISWLDDSTENASEKAFFNITKELSSYLNRTCYTGINSGEFHYALYKIDSFYKRHLDQFTVNNKRLFSIISYINDDWQKDDGGELVLYLKDGDIIIQPQGGRVVFFKSSEIEHEVLPSKRERMSVTGWLRK